MSEPTLAAWVPYGRTLRNLRTQAELTCRQLAARASCADSLISKVERGRRRVSKQVNNHLATALEKTVPGANHTLTQAYERAVYASQYSWHTDIADLEAQAALIQIWEPLLVPGVLQTLAYSTTVFTEGRPHASSQEIDELVQARMERTQTATDKELWAVMDETVLYRTVGCHQTMADQLQHLVDLSCKKTKITVVPQNAPYCGGLAGSIILLSDHARTSVYVEHTAGGDIITNPADVARISAVWREISAWALSPAVSTRAIKAAITWHTQQG